MAKKQVIECTCDRCERTWYEDPEDNDGGAEASFKFVSSEESIDISFDLLCEACKKAVRNYIGSILREPKSDAKEKVIEAVAPPPPPGA